jgi:hypothetical protein
MLLLFPSPSGGGGGGGATNYMLMLSLTSDGSAPPPPIGGDIITDTTKLQLPVNCVLAGQQEAEVGKTEIEATDPNIRARTRVSRGGSLKTGDPTFRVRTDKRGYD